MADTAADIPGKYDVLIDGHGYILANPVAPSLPFRTQRGRYGYTPTFVVRSNVSGNYGDNQQDFFLTVSQKDWSLGQDQKFFRSQDEDSVRQFWDDANMDISIPGQVSINYGPATTATAYTGAFGVSAYNFDSCFTSTSANLREFQGPSNDVNRGAHGAGGVVEAYAFDGKYLFLSGPSCTSVRRYDATVAHTFAAFCATPMEDLCYLNNTLYGIAGANFYTIDTAGTATIQFTWKDGSGTALATGVLSKIKGFGGKIVIMRATTTATELWVYDGTGVSKLAEFPANFVGYNFCVQEGIIFIVGHEWKAAASGTAKTAVWYFANGSIGRAYVSQVTGTGIPTNWITPWGTGVMFSDVSSMKYYDLSVGAVSTVAGFTAGTTTGWAGTSKSFLLITNGSSSYTVWPTSGTPGLFSFNAYLMSSLYDFDSTLTKQFRGITVDFIPGTGGGTIDIYYSIDSVGVASSGGLGTLLQSAASTGVEYLLPSNTTGRSIQVQLRFNLTTGSTSPILKRIYVRAAPTLVRFRTGEYVLDLTGRDGKTPVMFRNGNPSPLDGQQMLNNLVASAISSAPISITDRLGTFTGVVLLDQMDIIELRPQEYYVHMNVREI